MSWSAVRASIVFSGDGGLIDGLGTGSDPRRFGSSTTVLAPGR